MITKFKFICLYLFLLIHLFSQSISQNFSTDGSSILEASWKGITQPLHWGGEDFKTFGYVILGAGVFIALDNSIKKTVRSNQSSFFDSLEPIGNKFGKPATAGILALGLFSIGIITDDKWVRETATLLTSTLIVSGLYQSFAKTALGRARPSTNVGRLSFDPFSKSPGYHSLPSGHTTSSMSISLVMAHQVKPTWLKYTFYGLGGITMWSRLYNNAHWASDIFLGAALTYYSFKTNLSFLKQDDSESSTSLFIMPSRNGISLSLLL